METSSSGESTPKRHSRHGSSGRGQSSTSSPICSKHVVGTLIQICDVDHGIEKTTIWSSGLLRCTLLRLSVEANHRIDGTSMHVSSVELSVVWSEGDDPDAGHVAQLQDISTIAARALNKCITTQTGIWALRRRATKMALHQG
jgi:hypothetical protein